MFPLKEDFFRNPSVPVLRMRVPRGCRRGPRSWAGRARRRPRALGEREGCCYAKKELVDSLQHNCDRNLRKASKAFVNLLVAVIGGISVSTGLTVLKALPMQFSQRMLKALF